MNDRVRVDLEGHVAVVSLARPEKRNAVDMAMFDGICAAAESVRAEKQVRAVVLTADGSDFCAGIDVSVFAGAGIGHDGPDIATPLDGTAANVVQHAEIQRLADEYKAAALNGTEEIRYFSYPPPTEDVKSLLALQPPSKTPFWHS